MLTVVELFSGIGSQRAALERAGIEYKVIAFCDIDKFYRAQKVNSNAQLYKQAGNSIVVNVLVEIFKEMMKNET